MTVTATATVTATVTVKVTVTVTASTTVPVGRPPPRRQRRSPGVAAPQRGRRYALSACRALAPLARATRRELILTCDPDNLASRRTIELLGAVYLDEVAVPVDDPQYERGSRSKLRFLWMP